MSELSTTQSLWETVKEELKSFFPPDVFQMWFEPLRCLDIGDDFIVLGAPNDFATIWIQDNYFDLINERLGMAAGRTLTLSLRRYIEEPLSSLAVPGKLPVLVSRDPERLAEVRVPKKLHSQFEGRGYILNPRNSFETFVVGSNNQLAHAACIAVAKAPAHAYNPLFLYGDTGLGKTHLMHAVGHHILRQNSDAHVAYVSSEKFTNEFIHGIQENTLTKFRKRYRNVDILLIDDIHFLSGKERIQEEFFHTFNDLFESQKQIILSSDRPANEISKLESRLVSRFQWGLVADIQPPDLETRIAILRSKAKILKFDISEDITNFIARRISKNIRRLEGALIKVSSFSALTGRPIDIGTVEHLLQDILQEEVQNQITVEMIQKKIVDFYQLRISDMVSKRRPSNIAFPRQIAMYLSRILTSLSLQDIGEAFGGRDHGTVIHACKAVENMMEQDDSIRTNVEYLKSQLSKQT